MSSALTFTDTSSVASSTRDPAKVLWMETQWTNLSLQAKNLGLPRLPYFDSSSMLLSKEVNKKLWRQLARLYDLLGPDKAPYATPIMVEGGEVKWHSFLDGSKGDIADVYEQK